jgi:hypothetical protein
MTQEPTRTFDQAMVSVWEDELKATRDPSLKQQLSYREDELLPRLTSSSKPYAGGTAWLTKKVEAVSSRHSVAACAGSGARTGRHPQPKGRFRRSLA